MASSSNLSLFFKQLWIMLWKCYIIRINHYISTFFELIGPLIALLIICIVKNKIPSKSNNSDSDFELKSNHFEYNPHVHPIYYDKQDISFIDALYFAPDDDYTRKLISMFTKSDIEFHGFTSKKNLEDAILNLEIDIFKNNLAVYFDSVSGDEHLSYTMYMFCQSWQLAELRNAFPTKIDQNQASDQYYTFEDQVKMSSYINWQYVKNVCDTKNVPCNLPNRTEFVTMPYPEHKSDRNYFSIFDLLGLVLILSYILLCPLIVKRVTDEKSTKSKEMLRMIGMWDFVFWFSHFLNYFIGILIHSIVITMLLCCFSNSFVKFSSPVLIFVMLVQFGIQMILFSMLITTIMNRPVIAVIVTCLLWIMTAMLLFSFLNPAIRKDVNIEKSNPLRILSSFLPTGSLMWHFSMLGYWEYRGVGLHANNYCTSTNNYQSFTPLTVSLISLLSIPLYAFLIWYLDNIWPFQFGVPKSPYFLFKPSYWFPKTCPPNETENHKLDSRVFEPEPVSLQPSIRIQNVSKSFRTLTLGKKTAVDNLSLNIYENQLTVLLGHNGAGKSTAMNMITGIHKSSSGSVYVDSFNVMTQTNRARRSIGLCPQENIIFNELTVYQHLKLYAGLKDFSFSQINTEIKHILDSLNLNEKKNELAINLSGGMKRKLALGIAMIGKTQILILDEPTSGMDPEARRTIWNLLISLRRERTILLTTHYMEEADVLADRIAIMNDGRLCCSGSPFFLKNAFGSGYQLRVETLRHFDSVEFLKRLQYYIPTASLHSEIETEVIYCINPKGDKKAQVNQFPSLFKDIETNKSSYHINSIGLTYSSLEDVFLKVGSDMKIGRSDSDPNTNSEGLLNNLRVGQNIQLNTGVKLLLAQFCALLLKRLHFARRYLPMVILQLIIPTIIIIVAIRVDNSLRNNTQDDTSEIKYNLLDTYGPNTKTFYSGVEKFNESFFQMNTKLNKAAVNYIPPGGNITKWILDNSVNLNDYITKHIYGFETEPSFIGPTSYQSIQWYNTEQTYSPLLSIQNMFETFLWKINGPPKENQAYIRSTIQPILQQTKKRLLEKEIASVFIVWGVTCLAFMPLAFPFLGASYLLFPIHDQSSNCKQLQLMTGVSPALFWTANYLFDLIYHTLAISLIYLFIYLFDSSRVFFNSNTEGISQFLFLLLFAFGVGFIPFSYLVSKIFRKPSSGFVVLVIVSFIFGLLANALATAWDLSENFFHMDILSSVSVLVYFIRFVPIFPMLFGYQKVYKLSSFGIICDVSDTEDLMKFCLTVPVNTTDNMQKIMLGCCADKCGDMCFTKVAPYSFSPYGSGIEVLFLFLTGIIYLLILILSEAYQLKIVKFFSTIRSSLLKPRNQQAVSSSPGLNLIYEDDDVLLEKEKVHTLLETSRTNLKDLLYVNDLSKRFNQLQAVDNLTFSVRYDECFGLLGVNGAGKTTTFSMLVGNLLPSSGNAFIKKGKYNLASDRRKFVSNIGYCPQFNALLSKMTGREMLNMFAMLRGVTFSQIKSETDSLIQMVGLEKHADKLTATYSGGNKRKLSIAISLIGKPSLLFLDEPTAGVDPAARRKIWLTLSMMKKHLSSSIVLTSHSMEECEALCSRIAIMVNGKFCCMGTTQHLRTKYGQGYTILIRLKREHETDMNYVNRIQNEISQKIRSSSLKDYHQCLMQYHVMDPRETWSNIFAQLAILDQIYHFEDYVVSDTTLESIFIMFARNQSMSVTA